MGKLVLILLLSGTALAAREEDDPAVAAERDALIEKIAKGQEYEASVKRFGELALTREQKIASTQAARDQERATQDAQRKVAEERRKARDEYHKTLDYEVSWRCTLSPDPANPIPSKEGRFKPDWGKVIR